MKKFRFFLLALTGLTLLVVFWQRQTIDRLQNDNGILRARASELEQSHSANPRLAGSEGDADQLARLRKEHSELLRLRGETAVLREQLKSKASMLKTSGDPSTTASESPVKIFTANVEAELAPQQTLVLGGWPASDGKRTFLLVTPSLIDAAGNLITPDGTLAAADRQQILLETLFAEVPETLSQTLGLKSLHSAGNQSSSQLVLTREQSDLLLKGLGNLPGRGILSTPNLTTLNGRQAQVSVTEEKSIDNQIYSLGPTVNVLPQVSPDGRLIKLSVGATSTRESIRK